VTFGGSASVNGNVRTYLVFLDLPVHYEYRVPDMPMMTKGVVVEFFLTLKDPRTRHSRLIEGPYEVTRCKLISLAGLTQYIELTRVP
jgi:hypothetical protein